VATSAQAEDAVVELLQNTFGQPACSYTDVETRETVVRIYLPQKPLQILDVGKGLERIGNCGLEIGRGKISLGRIRREDWAESWKRHFKPIAIGSALLLRPSWSRRRPASGQALVVLDPGLSFGTGQHPTTAFCLRQLTARRPGRTPRSRSFLDIGTGSGILAIAAAKLGYAPVKAFDFDPDAVRIAKANARRNGVARKIRFMRQDVTRLPARSARKHSVICANLMADLLLNERNRILARLELGAMLVLAGILKSEFEKVRQAYEAAGLRLIASRGQEEWRSGAFRQSVKLRTEKYVR
jgi:ribosomal protein L11 methyltransferase